MVGSSFDPPVTLSPAAVRDLLFASNAEVQARFRVEFPAEIERAVAGVAAAHRALDLFRHRLQASIQTATLELFFHSAVNAVVCSLHHLVSGYPIAAGNLMRHYTESVAMTLLCLDPALGYLDEYSRNRKTFPIQDAPTKLRRRRVRAALERKRKFDSDAWETVLEIAELYNQLSHASALSLGHQLLLTTDDMMIIGARRWRWRGCGRCTWATAVPGLPVAG